MRTLLLLPLTLALTPEGDSQSGGALGVLVAASRGGAGARQDGRYPSNESKRRRTRSRHAC